MKSLAFAKTNRLNRFSLVLALAGLCIAFMFPDNGLAQSTTKSADITWTAPTTNQDGSPLTDLAGYKLMRANGACPFTGQLQPLKDLQGNAVVLNAQTTKYNDNNLPLIDGKLAYNVLAFDTAQNDSLRSVCAELTLNLNPPAAPTGTSAVLK